MRSNLFTFSNRQVQIGLALVIVLVLVFLLWFQGGEETEPEPVVVEEEPISEPMEPLVTTEVVGMSVEGREIEAVTFRSPTPPQNELEENTTHTLFVGGIHGGYEWNTVLLAYKFIDHFQANPEAIPAGAVVSIIPNANPDAVFKLVQRTKDFTEMDVMVSSVSAASTRFNASGVDLNRNFACKWAPESSWRGEVVSAGSEAFSEPEARAIRDFVLAQRPDQVVFWHSAAGNVYGSECEAGILPGTMTLMNTYAKAAGYGAVPSFDAYPITGDAEGWLASIGIPAVTVELTTHNDLEWEKNLRGVQAVLPLR